MRVSPVALNCRGRKVKLCSLEGEITMLHGVPRSISKRLASFAAALMAGVITVPASATQWTATVGAQSPDLVRTVLAFLPDEIWIHTGDSVRFTFSTEELHS